MPKIEHRYDGMSFEVVAEDVRVKYKDYFHLANFYKLMHEWFVMEGWAPGGDTKWPEQLYLQRESQQSGREYWIWWRFSKELNAVFRWDLDVDIHILLVKDTEVMWEGKKFKTNWGQPEVKMYAKLVYDYNKTFKKHPILKNFKDIYFKRIVKKEKEQYRKQLHREVNRVADILKQYFKYKSYLPEQESIPFFVNAKLEET